MAVCTPACPTACGELSLRLRRDSRHSRPRMTIAMASLELIGQRLRLPQTASIETFGEPAVERGKEVMRLAALALSDPKPCDRGRGA